MYNASEGGHVLVVALLLSKGAEVDSRDEVSTYNNIMYCIIIIIQSMCGIVEMIIYICITRTETVYTYVLVKPHHR